MTLLHISELAERSGVPSSTLRYYERIGLVEPLGRSDNGYRVYDEVTVERLAFIGRAKRLGMSLDDVATLVEAWFAGDCEPLQERLRGFVRGRLGELRRKILEDTAFERELERILVRLEEEAAPERCRPDCGCDTDPLDVAGADAGAPRGLCSLGDGEVQRRIAEWQQILGTATHTERAGGRVSAVFESSAGAIAELARLCAAEVVCCPFLTFDLEISAAAIVLTIGAPAGSGELVGLVFDQADSLTPGSATIRTEAMAVPGRRLRSRGPQGAAGTISVCAPAASKRRQGRLADAGEVVR